MQLCCEELQTSKFCVYSELCWIPHDETQLAERCCESNPQATQRDALCQTSEAWRCVWRSTFIHCDVLRALSVCPADSECHNRHRECYTRTVKPHVTTDLSLSGTIIISDLNTTGTRTQVCVCVCASSHCCWLLRLFTCTFNLSTAQPGRPTVMHLYKI